jgi:hypothetical protein
MAKGPTALKKMKAHSKKKRKKKAGHSPGEKRQRMARKVAFPEKIKRDLFRYKRHTNYQWNFSMAFFNVIFKGDFPRRFFNVILQFGFKSRSFPWHLTMAFLNGIFQRDFPMAFSISNFQCDVPM